MNKESYPGQHLEILAKQLVTLVINYGPPFSVDYEEAERKVAEALKEFGLGAGNEPLAQERVGDHLSPVVPENLTAGESKDGSPLKP